MVVIINDIEIDDKYLSSYSVNLNLDHRPSNQVVQLIFTGSEEDEKYFKDIGLKLPQNTKITYLKILNNEYKECELTSHNEPDGVCMFMKNTASLSLYFTGKIN